MVLSAARNRALEPMKDRLLAFFRFYRSTRFRLGQQCDYPDHVTRSDPLQRIGSRPVQGFVARLGSRQFNLTGHLFRNGPTQPPSCFRLPSIRGRHATHKPLPGNRLLKGHRGALIGGPMIADKSSSGSGTCPRARSAAGSSKGCQAVCRSGCHQGPRELRERRRTLAEHGMPLSAGYSRFPPVRDI
jgi:hypothetical protein